jgi:hypothetical protein
LVNDQQLFGARYSHGCTDLMVYRSNTYPRIHSPHARLAWNALEMVGAIGLGMVAQSLALAAFGPDESPLGIAYLAVTAAVMPTLGALQRTKAGRLEAEPLAAEARMPIIDAALTVAAL